MANEPGKSLDEIADMMAANTLAMRGAPVPEPAQEETTDEESNVDPITEVVSEDDGGEPLSDSTDDVGSEGDDEDSQPESDAVQDEAPDGSNDFEIDDEDVLALEDGQEVSIGALKKLYTADETKLKAIEATEAATHDALIERQRALEDAQRAQQAAQVMFQNMAQVIDQPLVASPNEGLRQTDPAAYLAQLEAFQQDQQRIASSRTVLLDAMKAHATEQENVRNAQRAQALQELVKRVPALASEETKPQASQDIIDAGNHYGFSPEEINGATDYRVYQMAYDAQQYRKMMAKSGPQAEKLVKETQQEVRKQTRTLRSKGTSATSRPTAAAKQHKRLVSKAQKSGRVDDVAAMIASKSRLR